MYERDAPPDRDAETEQLLSGGLAALGERGGRMGGGAAGASGGGLGARLAARLLRTTHHEEAVELADAPAEDVLDHLGQVVWSASDGLGGREVRGLIGSGALNMNPTVVDVHVHADGRVDVHAAAKEGLIPQRTARKAVRRTIETLQRAAPPS